MSTREELNASAAELQEVLDSLQLRGSLNSSDMAELQSAIGLVVLHVKDLDEVAPVSEVATAEVVPDGAAIDAAADASAAKSGKSK